MQFLSIGQVAKQTGVGVETLRFYEREGLIPEPARRPSGYRDYPPDAVRRIQFIRHAKALGFSLKEIHDLLELRVDPNSSCADVRQQTAAKIQDIDLRIQSLTRMRQALSRLSGRCRGSGPTTDCPILEEMNRQGDAND